MENSIPLNQLLDDLAQLGIPADEAVARADLTSFWLQLPDEAREDVLAALGLPTDDLDAALPYLEGSEVVFPDPLSASQVEPEDPSLEAAEALLGDAAVEPVPVLDEGPEGEIEMLEDLDELEALEPLDEAGPDAPGEALEGPETEEAFDALDPIEPEPLEELDELEDLQALEELEELAPDEVAPLDDLEGLEAPEPAEGETLDAAALEALDPSEGRERDETDPDAEVAALEADLHDLDSLESISEIAGVEDPEGLEEPEDEDTLAGLSDLAGGPGHEVDESSVEEVEIYPVYEPYAYVRISYDSDHHQYLYEVIEPELNEREQKILQFIEETIIDVIDVGLSKLTEKEAEAMVEDLTDQVIRDYSIEVDDNARMRLTYYTIRDFTGFGKLDVLMRDDMIEDISCDGSNIPIFLYHRKYESMASTVLFEEDSELDSFVIKLAQRSGKHISIADPLLDARLPDGSRLNATLSREVTAQGSTFTIRKFKDEPFTPPDLVRFGTQSPEMLAYFWMAIQHGASTIYAGGTASGKTTALNAILLFIPPQMKIVSIEDTRELNLPHPNWIPGTTRSGFGSRDDSGRRAGEIDMFELLKAALRQRPEFIAVGEVRGEEATVLFQAMATGHAAYGTMHADSVSSVIHRLEGEPINIPRPLLEALDVVAIQMQTRIGGKRVRRTKEVIEIVGLDPNTKELLTNEVFRWDPATDEFDSSGISYVLERIQRENNLTKQELQEEMEHRTLIIQWMVEQGVRDYKAVAKVVQAYYNEPEETIARIRQDLSMSEDEQLAQSFGTELSPPEEYDVDDEDLDLFPDLPALDDGSQALPEAFDPSDPMAEDSWEPPEPAGGLSVEEMEALYEADRSETAQPGAEAPPRAGLEPYPPTPLAWMPIESEDLRRQLSPDAPLDRVYLADGDDLDPLEPAGADADPLETLEDLEDLEELEALAPDDLTDPDDEEQ